MNGYCYIIGQYNQILEACNPLIIHIATLDNKLFDLLKNNYSDLTEKCYLDKKQSYFCPPFRSLPSSEEALAWEHQCCLAKDRSLTECLENNLWIARLYSELLTEICGIYSIFVSELETEEILTARKKRNRSYFSYKDDDGTMRYVMSGHEGFNASLREMRLRKLIGKIIEYTVQAKAVDLYGQSLLHRPVSQAQKGDRVKLAAKIGSLENLRKEIFSLQWPSDRDPIATYEHISCAELKLSLLSI